jgi:hypothetical protein
MKSEVNTPVTASNNKKKRQLTQYDTRIYFVPDTREVDQKRNELNALNAQLGQLSTQEKSIQAAKVSGIVIIALEVIRLLLLGLTYPSLKLYALLHLDLSICPLLYVILLLAEGYTIKRAKRSRHFWAYAILWIFFLYIYFYARENATTVAVAVDFFLICALFHLYPLIIGISQTYGAFKREQANQREVQEKKNRQKNLQNKHVQPAKSPTDQEFDAWLENKVEECLTNTIRKIGLQDEIKNYRQLLRVRGYVLLGMKDAKHYRNQDLRYKKGSDGKRRYSINLYTYFYLGEHRVVVFTYAINAMNWNDYRETTKEYFYQDVIGVNTEDDSDNVNIDGKLHRYRTQRFFLSLRDGNVIRATVRSQPLSDTENLPIFEIPQSNLEATVALLRKSLQSKKA